ncbi:MAG: GGDEF domain-containing protein, partial [Fimbriimonadaceae bacterium]
MSRTDPKQGLESVLSQIGIKTLGGENDFTPEGFPVLLPLPDGSETVLDLATPNLLDRMGASVLGMAILDHAGFVRSRWGLAEKQELFEEGACLLESQIGSSIEAAFRGDNEYTYFNGYRFATAGLNLGDQFFVLVMVLDASEEKESRLQAQRSACDANALKRIGKALTNNRSLRPLAIAATHAISSSTELSAALLWVRTEDSRPMELIASIGVSKSGVSAINQIDTEKGNTCAAELACDRQQPKYFENVHTNLLTKDLEGKFCYLKPKGMMVLPLCHDQRILGVLELIGRESDIHFKSHEDLFQTVAEHLALALNSAIMFESMERQATHDPLTGIANHRHMQEVLQTRIAEAARASTKVGLIMIDVDHFRNFNEEEGHDAGDKVLKLVGAALSDTMRVYDTAARYGGEEFTVIMPGADLEVTKEVAER